MKRNLNIYQHGRRFKGVSALDVDNECFNQHFLTIAHKTIGNLPFYVSSLNVPDMIMAEVDVGEVYRHIYCLNIHKAMGVDNISIRFIKASQNSMAMLLTKLINKSIASHTFPDIWKNAVVIPVQKSNQSSLLSNFRPLSILPVFSTVLERVVFDQVVNHFTMHDLFSNRQSGFCNGYSTQDMLLHVSDSWLRAIDTGCHFFGLG